MDYSEKAAEYLMRAFGEKTDSISVTDPEFYSFFTNFAFGEVPSDSTLDEKTRHICILAVLLGCGGCDEFERMLSAALACGVTAAEARETVYQAAAYLGIGRVRPFFEKMNKVFCSIGPLRMRVRPRPQRVLKRGIRRRLKFSARECVNSGKMLPRTERTLTCGLPTTVSAIITRAAR